MTNDDSTRLRTFTVESGPLAGTIIEVAPSDEADALEPQVQRILDALDHSEALVTDEARISDFTGFFNTKEEREAKVRRLSMRLGIPVDERELVVDVARRLLSP